MEFDLSLHDYWRIIQKRKWAMLFVALATFASTAFYTRLQVPTYRTSAVVKFEPPATKMGTADLGAYDPWTGLETQLRIIMSNDVSLRAARRLGWPADKVLGQIRAERISQSNLISMTASGPDAAAVAALVNAAVDAYYERDLEERSQQARKTLRDVMARREEVEESLSLLEDRRKEYLATHQTANLRGSLQGQLFDLETRRKELLKKFTPEHPDILAMDKRIEGLQRQVAQVPGQELELERLMRDLRVNEEMYVALSRQLEEAKITLASTISFVAVISRAEIPGAPVSPNKKLNYTVGLLLGLFLGVMLAMVLENLDISISTIEDIEKVLGVPVLGIIPHFGAAENRWQMLRTRLLRRARYPMEVFRSQMVFHHRPKSPIIEVYHSLRANIQSQLPKPENMTLTFTSTGVAEGKTLTAVNFSLAASQGGMRTLLVGADIRRPVVHKIFGLPKQPGFIEVITGQCSIEEAVRDTVDYLMGEIDLDKLLAFPGIDNFKVMTGWTTTAAEMVNILSSPRLPRVIEDMRSRFDLVVFDCPPVLLFVDSLLFSPNTDGVVLVYKAGKMARRALKRAKDQLVASKANIIGVVLNDMQATDMEPRYGYYYDYGHYAKEEEEKA